MAVLTTDILLTGIRRDLVFEWLGDFGNHKKFLKDAFDQVKELSATELELHYKAKFKKRVIKYSFLEHDSSHGGRRVKIQTTGKRTSGKLNYSLRTMKPSSNTLVTLHFDYDSGQGLGSILNSISIKETLETYFTKALVNLNSQIPKTK